MLTNLSSITSSFATKSAAISVTYALPNIGWTGCTERSVLYGLRVIGGCLYCPRPMFPTSRTEIISPVPASVPAGLRARLVCQAPLLLSAPSRSHPAHHTVPVLVSFSQRNESLSSYTLDSFRYPQPSLRPAAVMVNDPGAGRSSPQDLHARHYMFLPPTVGSKEDQKSK